MEKYIADIIRLQGKCSYNAENKAQFRAAALKFLRALRALLGIDADIRWNAGGIAVSGDATLHSDTLYVSFNADNLSGLGILYRSCRGRKDFTGGRNCHFSWGRLREYQVTGFAACLAQCTSVPHEDEPNFEEHNAARQFFARP